jgi:N-methylhydantoinase A
MQGTTIGIDMGGTFVDCVARFADGTTIDRKAATTPDDPVDGILAALRSVAEAAGQDLPTLLGEAETIVHGTTLGLNAIIARTGGRVGLLTTRGHEDALAIGRVHQKVAGLRPEELTRPSELRKPAPLVPRTDIAGIDERIDANGQVVVPLDEAGVVRAAMALAHDGCAAIAISFLWGHAWPDHELRAAVLVASALPEIPVARSSEIAPILGEYERTAATVVDAALREPFGRYLDRLGSTLRAEGASARLWVMGMVGGVIPWEEAAARPVETLRSGPVGGVVASADLGRRLGRPSLIATDMGGTSFDLGLLVDGEPIQADQTLVGQFHVAVPSVEIRSIGAGGGSIAWLDDTGMHVGPRSAGAMPGPACYGRGGTKPTVTDADLVLGRLADGQLLGGEIRLDAAAAAAAIEPLARRLGLGTDETAAGIVDVADAEMANLIRTTTLERGHDPRRFSLVAFGGAGPLHVGGYASALGIEEALIPPSASVLSALGLATADHRRTYRRSLRRRLPVDPGELSEVLATLEREAEADLARSGVVARLETRAWAAMRYRRQTHVVRTPVERGPDGAIDAAVLGPVFETRFEGAFGPGTGYAAAGIEIVTVGLDAVARRPGHADAPPHTAKRTNAPPITRSVWFGGWQETAILDGDTLEAGATVDGPAIVGWGATSVVVAPGRSVTLDREGVLHLRLGTDAGT